MVSSSNNRLTLLERKRIKVHGKIQEIGFRPIVYGLALEPGLLGFVLSDECGLFTGIECSTIVVDSLDDTLTQRVRVVTRVDSLISEVLPWQSNNLKLRRSKHVSRNPRADS